MARRYGRSKRYDVINDPQPIDNLRLVKVVRSKLSATMAAFVSRNGINQHIAYRKIDTSTDAGRKEALSALSSKLIEEASKVNQTPLPDELADVLAVIRGIAHNNGIAWQEVLEKYEDKRRRKGDFEELWGMYVSTSGRID